MKEYFLNGIYYKKNTFSKKRKTIVFVHGVSGSSSAWTPYERSFNKKYNIISIDLRGHGKSFRPNKLRDYSIRLFAEDILKVIKKEEIDKFILVSHSFGNLPALEFIRKHQNRVKAVILISPDASPSRRRLTRIILPVLGIAKLMDYLPSLKKKGAHIDYRKHIGSGDWNIKRTIADISNTGIKSYLFSIYHAYKSDFENFLPKIKVPVLILHGKNDTIFPVSSSLRIKELIKHSKAAIIEDADHIIVLNKFKTLAKEIKSFAGSLK